MAACGSARCTCLVVTCIVCYVLVSLPLVFGLLGVWEPRRQGFFCGDESISLPYTRDTVSLESMLGVSLGGAVLVALAEGFCAKRRGLKRSAIFVNSLICAGMLLFVMAAGMSAVFVMKLSMGNLRPHFLAVCKVNATFTCSPGSYVTDDVCTGDVDVIRNARSSFPSGHAGLAGCLAAYVVLYLHDRVRNKSWVLPRLVVQVGLVLGCLFIMGSRVADHQHRLADVIGGAVIGVAFGAVGMWVTKDLTKTTGKRGVRQDTDIRFSAGRESVNERSAMSSM
ncbi:phospholipid phosphatase 1-like [Branchiostoma lanceolatum]|uniref:phospholipid phosphatase 1-like n=1 Tax=Branchiostoma lanceolatum TaxID=7740 RepID=UPI003455883D